MKKTLPTLIKYVLICATAWLTNAAASQVQYQIETYADESSTVNFEQIHDSKFVTSTGQIRRPYQQGNMWIRIKVENFKKAVNLYFENPSIDELFLYSKDPKNSNIWLEKRVALRELLHGHLMNELYFEELTQDATIYLKIKTSSSKQFNVMVLSDAEVRQKEFTKYAVLSSQITAALILMIWVAMQNWLARSKIFITVIISTPLFVLSRLNYFGLFLNEESSNTSMYLNLNMVLFLALISGGTLMVKESFGRLFSTKQNIIFLLFFVFSLLPSIGLLFDLPRAHIVMCSLIINFLMVLSLFANLTPIFISQRHLISNYKFQLIIFFIYSLMSTLPGFYFIAPQIFPFALGIPAYRDFFYPVLAFLIMVLMLNEQREKEMDTIFNLAVSKANADLESEKNKKQHIFLGMLLHEIKTPLSVIKFGAAALTNDTSKNHTWTGRIDSAADSINHILNQCLLADKFEFGLSGYSEENINLQFEISKLVERVGYLNPTYLDRIDWKIVDTLPIETTITVDPIFLRSVLENLVTNALKYSATNSMVYVTVAPLHLDIGEFIEFQIKNQIGKIGPPQIDKIFSRYYRAEEAQGYSGTGLGLWLANQQANEMGSTIQCTFDDTWTTFSFQLRNLKELS